MLSPTFSKNFIVVFILYPTKQEPSLADLVQMSVGSEQAVSVVIFLVVRLPGAGFGEHLPVVLGGSIRTPGPDRATDVDVIHRRHVDRAGCCGADKSKRRREGQGCFHSRRASIAVLQKTPRGVRSACFRGGGGG